jgi:hypothetical protein
VRFVWGNQAEIWRCQALAAILVLGAATSGTSKVTTRWPPNPDAILRRVATVGAWWPDSSREIADFVVPTR